MILIVLTLFPSHTCLVFAVTYSFTPAVHSKHQYDIEMTEKKRSGNASNHDYDPYKMRNVEHPTS